LTAYAGIGTSVQADLLLAALAPGLGLYYGGNAVANIFETVSPNHTNGVYVGTAGSTPAYFGAPPPSQGLQGNWNLQFTLGTGALNQNSQVGMTHVGRSGSGSGASYVTMSATVPADAVALVFEYEFEGTGQEDDFITMGIGGDDYFSVPAKLAAEQVWNTSPPIDVADFAGQDIQLTFVLNSMTGTPTGTLQIRNAQFVSLPPPKLSLTISEEQATLTWPISAVNWTLEANENLLNAAGWGIVNVTPTDSDFVHSVTLDITNEEKFFFRLRK
jgi:hypothetical protein